MTARADLPGMESLPIPPDAVPGAGWTGQMLEMADHIGAYATLLVVDRFGGERIYVPIDAKRSPFADLLDPATVATLSHVYGGVEFSVPVGRTAVARAKRAPVLAAVRAGRITGGDAARILGTSRSYLAHLANQTDEGTGVVLAQLPSRKIDPRQLDMFAEDPSASGT